MAGRLAGLVPITAMLLARPVAAYAQQPPPVPPEAPEAPQVPQTPRGPQIPPAPRPQPPPPPPPPAAPPVAAPAPAAAPKPAAPPPPPPVAPVVVPPPPVVASGTAPPLAGFSDGTAFLRAPGGEFILFPSGRLQLDGYLFRTSNKAPTQTFLIRRARLEVTGWIGPWAYFSLAGDFAAGPPSTTAAPVAQSNLQTTDDYLALAPRGNLVVLQVGQFDAPFTLENRTSDKYFDFLERSITVRAFGIPENKEIGAMVWGTNEPRNFLYSIGVFNGDGQNFKNVDKNFDAMGRAWIAPFSFGRIAALHDVAIGGSFRTGDRTNGLALPSQSTQGGFTFLSFAGYNATVGAATLPMQLRQVGRLRTFAGELNAPIDHRFGVRGELVWRHSPLSEEDVTNSAAPVIRGGANLQGWSTYAELWFWALGDDRIIGDQQGIEPLTRAKPFAAPPLRHGLMFAFRLEHLDETVTPESDAAALNLKDPAVGGTQVTTYELGINYWHSKRFRASFNYVFNHLGGDTAQMKSLRNPNVQEFLFRLGIAL